MKPAVLLSSTQTMCDIYLSSNTSKVTVKVCTEGENGNKTLIHASPSDVISSKILHQINWLHARKLPQQQRMILQLWYWTWNIFVQLLALLWHQTSYLAFPLQSLICNTTEYPFSISSFMAQPFWETDCQSLYICTIPCTVVLRIRCTLGYLP